MLADIAMILYVSMKQISERVLKGVLFLFEMEDSAMTDIIQSQVCLVLWWLTRTPYKDVLPFLGHSITPTIVLQGLRCSLPPSNWNTGPRSIDHQLLSWALTEIEHK